MRGFYTAYIHVGGMVYMAFMANLLLTIANLPLLFLFVATDVRVTWLPVLALTPLLTISLAAIFTVFERFTYDGTVNVVREFVRAWASYARRAGTIGLFAGMGMFVLAVDIAAVWGTAVGGAAIPLFCAFMALLLATAMHVVVAITLRVEGRSGIDLWKACLYLAVRRWYLTLMSMLMIGLLLSLIYATPAWGAGLAASPILYVAWTNTRQALLPIAPASARLVANP